MKNVTEFWNVNLFKGLQAKEALAAEGKSPEEIQTSLGESFKMEGDKLKHFINAIDVASQNKDKLHRVLVVTFGEGEAVPPKAVKVEEHHYVPAFIKEAPAPTEKKDEKGGKGGRPNRGGGGGGKREGGPKSSPWGLTPEEIAAKKGAGKNKKA